MRDLYSDTLKLVLARPRSVTYEMIFADTGLTTHWLKLFAQDKFTDPGVKKTQKLYNYLAAKINELDVNAS